ncbi:mammalian cell entry protein [Nocardia otitidiscaviarum]|uniref:Mammalian cell entry protein n=2 Tax=Nocardia otitidiscaviarum TaxID=1823 RepID=A0A516NR95_9NOCA|nr:mammalian cell entry protein [Nocardia otitidiscaviarum]QDP81440.1 mammalian cell entry protein [Nocardia otitidiscaviarum]
MPNYGMPGVAVDRGRAMKVGAVAVAVVLAVTAAWYGIRAMTADTGLRISLHTEQIGDGVLAGTQVRLDGVLVGKVVEITPAARGTQRIALQLDESRLYGLDDSLLVDYAPQNLFGISEIELRRGAGGAPLRTGTEIDLTGAKSAAVYDATMGSLLRSMSQVGDSVLTPQLATVIAQVAADVEAFTPLAQAIVTASRTVVDNQKMPPSQLFGNLGPAFDGGGRFAGAAVEVVDVIRSIERLQQDRESYDHGVDIVVNKLLPTLSETLGQAGTQLSATTDTLAAILSVLAQMVPAPQRTAAELTELLHRLRAAMPDTPNGPVLNVEVDLRGVPAVAVPLLGAGGGR